MDDIEYISCVSVLQNGRLKFKYNLYVSVIQNGWVTWSPFHVLVFDKLYKWNSITTYVLVLYIWMDDIEFISCVIVSQIEQVKFD